ncbi:kinase-like domain-containing protein, partial [Mycena crocata]
HRINGGLPGEAKTMVCWQVCKGKLTWLDGNLGNSSKLWANSVYLNDIKSDVVKTVNIEWTKNTPIPLIDEDTSFRWAGARLLELDTSGLSLGEFYVYYSAPSKSLIYLANVPTMFKHFAKSAKTQPFICLELYINMDNVARKRAQTKSTAENSSSDAHKNKQARPTGMLSLINFLLPSSEFSLSKRRGSSVVQKQSVIKFKKINPVTAILTGECSLIEMDEVYCGYILDKPFASGTMKHAYDLQLDNGDQYVAKRFFMVNSDDAEDSVSVEVNRIEIEGEAIRLAVGKWFLDAFYRFCKSYKDTVAVDPKIVITDAFLAIEVDQPSKASAVPIISDEEEGITWLVERKRPTTVIKYSGTLVHRSNHRDMRSATISAFAHFVFGHSKASYILADLQGMFCHKESTHILTKDGLVLFDVMAHTPEGKSGVGDFGKKGIKSFVKDHKCGEICGGLMLHEFYPLKLNDNEEDDDGDDNDNFDNSGGDNKNKGDGEGTDLQVHG